MIFHYITPVYSSYNHWKIISYCDITHLTWRLLEATSRHLEPQPHRDIGGDSCETLRSRGASDVKQTDLGPLGFWWILGKALRNPMQASENLDVAPLPPNGHHHCQDFSIHVRGHSDPWDTSLPTLLQNRWITKNRDSASKHEEIHLGFTQRTWTILPRNATAMIAVHHRVSPLRSIFKMASAWPLAARWNQRPKKLQDGNGQDLNGPAVLVGNPPAVGKSPWLDAVKKNGLSRDRAPHSMLSNV